MTVVNKYYSIQIMDLDWFFNVNTDIFFSEEYVTSSKSMESHGNQDSNTEGTLNS